jgi:hypothetical protein
MLVYAPAASNTAISALRVELRHIVRERVLIINTVDR